MKKPFVNSILIFFVFISSSSFSSENNTERKFLTSGKILLEEVYSQTEMLSQGSLEDVIIYLKKLQTDKRYKQEYYQLFLKIQLASFYLDLNFKKGREILEEVAKRIKHHNWPYLQSVYLFGINVQQRTLGECNNLLKNNDSIDKLIPNIHPNFRHKIEIENILDRVSVYICLEDYSGAIEWLTKNETLFALEKTDKNSRLYFLNHLGFLHTQIGSYETALKYYLEVLQILQQEKSNELYFASVYNSLGAIYYMMNEIDKSLEYLNKAEVIYLKQNVNDDQLTFLYNLSELYLKLDLPNKALITANKMLLKANGIELYTAMANYEIAQSSLELKIINFDLSNLSQAINYFKKENYTDYFLNSLEVKAKILLLKGEYEEASNLLLIKAHAKDSILSEGKINNLQNLLLKYESDKKDHLIQLNAKQKELDDLLISQQRQFIFYLIFSLFVVVLASILFIRSVQQRNRFKRLEMRSKLARSQFNPHFINNAFASMQSMVIMEEDSDKLVDYISGVARFSRLMLESTLNDEWSLQNEIDFTNYFLKIHSIRFEDKLNYSLENQVPESNIKLVPCGIFQPVVENAIEYSGAIQQMGSVQIIIQQKENSILFQMKNSVKDTKISSLKRNTNEPSRGIFILKQRIELHSKIHKKKCSFNFELIDDFAITEIFLPIIVI